MIAPLRVILPLYNTEIHFVARANSPMNFIHDMSAAKINGGLVGSGAAFITHTLYRMMFGKPIPEANGSFLSNADALVKLISDESIDVVVVAAGQPAPLIANMRPEAQRFIKFLKFDPAHPSAKLPLTIYTQSLVRPESYPQLLKESFTTVAVGAYLVTYNFSQTDTPNNLARFARALCNNFSTLQSKGHPKWREVSLSLGKLPPGWTYYSPTAETNQRLRSPCETTGASESLLCRRAHSRFVRLTAGRCSEVNELALVQLHHRVCHPLGDGHSGLDAFGKLENDEFARAGIAAQLLGRAPEQGADLAFAADDEALHGHRHAVALLP